MNPIMQSLQRNNQIPNNVKQMYDAYRTAQNPRATLEQMARSNPMVSQLIGSGNLKDKFYSLCNQRGVNPDEILNKLRGENK